MTRIATYGANQLYLSRITALNERINKLTTQVVTEKKSPNYTGIAEDSNRLINFENEKSRSEAFIKNNDSIQTTIGLANVSLTAVQTTMQTFRDRLDSFRTNKNRTQEDIESIQNLAFQSMIDMQSYLSSTADGKYLFSGGLVSQEPVQLPAATRSGFTDIYDGFSVTYPTTRSAHMLDTVTKTATTGNLTFNAAAGTITAANAGTLSDFPVGSRITASGASASNNQTYTVVANTGTQIKVSRLTTEGPSAATISYYNAGDETHVQTLNANLTFTPGTDTIQVSSTTGFSVGQVFSVAGTTSNDGSYKIQSITPGPPNDSITVESVKVGATETVAATLTAESWYKGDNISIGQRIDQDRTVSVGVFASDPAFEKAFRAMGMIAQGQYGTAGGLENNLDRVEDALYLIRDAMLHPAGNQAPFGTEEASDLESVLSQLGTTQSLINTKTEKHKSYIGFLDDRIIAMENVDKNEAITLLLDDQRALEAGYQTLSKVREMSLINFMK
ncbi:flagellin [Magnetospirillum sp. 64-120]|mgnify:CR=1 FL=1|uniref:flagellin n=1 Tax=Magnetospirillum sp. 64-120 TaxID=1895778 RepID=UPI000927A119|nr:flagellin [Magnetospirillum sp. 64-120]OJX79600.1 MAG: hypothetical protein BGO92_14190 [Magnetospirillum sp. 64-120]